MQISRANKRSLMDFMIAILPRCYRLWEGKSNLVGEKLIYV